MSDFNSFDELFDKLEEDIIEETPKIIKSNYREIAERSYDLYDPKNDNTSRYRLGLSGSFADEINYIMEIEKYKNHIDFSMFNDRTSDCGCGYCTSHDTHLDYFVDEGVAGHGEGDITPKHVTQDVQMYLDSKYFEDDLSLSLKRRGWNIE